jgi:hypothetical protein
VVWTSLKAEILIQHGRSRAVVSQVQLFGQDLLNFTSSNWNSLVDGHNAALRAELSDFKSNIGRDMETLHNNQQQLGTAYTALTRPSADSVPSFINTDASTVVTQSQQAPIHKDMMSDLCKEMALLVNSRGNKVGNGNGNGPGGGGGGRGGGASAAPRARPTTWRQWDKWCWTHGSHLLHDSMTCDKKWRKAGHDEAEQRKIP